MTQPNTTEPLDAPIVSHIYLCDMDGNYEYLVAILRLIYILHVAVGLFMKEHELVFCMIRCVFIRSVS